VSPAYAHALGAQSLDLQAFEAHVDVEPVLENDRALWRDAQGREVIIHLP
jgi:hypothetical protein